MDPADQIPDDVVRFIEAHLDTVAQLEALLLVYRAAPRAWSVDEIAARLYAPAAEALRVLQHLERRALVTRDATERFAYRADEGTRAVAALSDVYGRQLVRVAQLIHSKASASVREFARAFEIKRER